ncbi:acyl-CoA dehydrogenase family protein [Nocardia pseudobrasiliensis]|uniref:Alkylation response protein AidB-like acyl-CoA dehydrogenase n=1 Tax=Nocardia pseudobrasiliensis TaxID=45979 RepID=A0A370I4D7_9NOCA|nr:acyl-CoA dehydrogenase [Nocardia pseudobrasiliensis]RDI65555.1 alkylation response protein AidB-like acyl-CoA dehydrogenase [Nocardia pseudobrasiliensis]
MEIEDVIAETETQARELLSKLTTDANYADYWNGLAPLGLLGASGEPGGGAVTRAVARIEGLGRAEAPAGIVYALTSQLFGLQFPLRRALSVAPDWLEDAETGKVSLCHALTEEGGGSDPLSMRTSAARQPDGTYLLTGRKAFVTAAPVAAYALVFARTSEGRQPFALTPFVVDLHTAGVTRSDPFPKTALTAVPMGAIDFDDAAALAMVGAEGSGLALLAATTAWERALLLSYALGPMHVTLQRCVRWAGERKQFGRAMGSSHLVAARIADMAACLFRSRRLVYDLAAQFDRATSWRRLATTAAMAKISLSEDFAKFTTLAAGLGGARSFVEGTGLTVDLISPAAAATYAGPNDLLRIAIARDLGLPVEN